MRVFLAVVFITVLMADAGQSQLKSQAEQEITPSRSLTHPSTSIGSLLGLLNAENFMMRHSFSLSYLTSGGQGLSIADYTNSMFYRISDPLHLRFDVTLQGSPFGQYGSAKQSDLSRVFVSRAELNYRPAQDVFISLQYRQVPYGTLGWYNPYLNHNRWGDE